VVGAALSESGLTWARIARELAGEMRVIRYDRAGTGWSDPPPRGRRRVLPPAGRLRSGWLWQPERVAAAAAAGSSSWGLGAGRLATPLARRGVSMGGMEAARP
jgi:pimeloyl-ACP methyl ester carboxylesterase